MSAGLEELLEDLGPQNFYSRMNNPQTIDVKTEILSAS